MKKVLAFGVLTLLAVVAVQAQLPAAKQQELAARGITNWTPGQNQGGNGAVFAPLGTTLSAPLHNRVPGDTQTMQYDDGALTALPTIFGAVYGNRFDEGLLGVALGALTLNSFSFYFMEDSVPDTGLFFQPSDPLNSMSISARASVNIAGLMNSGASFMTPVLNVIPQASLGTTGMFTDTFYLGGWCLNSNTMFPINNETLGLSTAEVNNGPRRKGYTAVSGTGAQMFSNQNFNAIIRANVTSAALVPVELMAFEVE